MSLQYNIYKKQFIASFKNDDGMNKLNYVNNSNRCISYNYND